MSNNESFEDLYNESLKNDTALQKEVTGKIINITSKGEIYVDIGYKADGIIPKSEYSFNEYDNPSDEFNIGDTIKAEVIKKNDGTGNVLLSYKKLKEKESRAKFLEKVNNNDVFEEIISGVTDKGVVVNYGGVRIFIPISLSGIKKGEDTNSYKGKKIKFRIIECDIDNRRVIGSNKIIADEEKQKLESEFWNNIKEGKEYTGIVSSVNSYGAFVDLGGAQGLLHISEVTWKRNVDANDYFVKGQEVKVIIKEVDIPNKKIKLAYPLKEENPWNTVDERYKINDIVKVTIKNFMSFGAFAELEEGIDGLIHISQISDEKIANVEDVLQVGQTVDAKIIELDKSAKKLGLSIKDANKKNYETELENIDGVTFES